MLGRTRALAMVSATVVVVLSACGGSGKTAVTVHDAVPVAASRVTSIEVRAQAGDGWRGVATIVGPGGSRSASLESGRATFGNLDEGVYDVTVSRESGAAPSSPDGADVGTATTILNGGRFGLAAGDHAVVTCDADRCTGVL